MPSKTIPASDNVPDASSLRLDLWLWSARLFKTRSLAAEAASKNRVTVNDQPAKPARLVRLGDRIGLRRPGEPLPQVVDVLGLARFRGPASTVAGLYAETPESQSARAEQAERLRAAPEPAASMAGGRPTKRDRRAITNGTERWQRWSASADDPDAG